MMKLKYLFNNQDLALMLLQNWNYDESSVELFKYFRISANAIYPFKFKDQLFFLRFAPDCEKQRSQLEAEHHFVTYLQQHGYSALKYVLSHNGSALETQDTPWGRYHASVFEGVPGKQLGQVHYDCVMAKHHGQALGKLHQLSSNYSTSMPPRKSYQDLLFWIKRELQSHENQDLPLDELQLVDEALSKLPQSPSNFGLVHYDFELDNVFFDDEAQQIHVIDFDDCVYHWYAMDLEQALDSIKRDVETTDFEELKAHFIAGYREAFELSDESLSQLHLFRRFANLYGYTRILRCLSETWQNEPEWMTGLRVRLERGMQSRSKFFGQPL